MPKQDETFEMSGNELYLALVTSGPSNASFVANYAPLTEKLSLVFAEPTPGEPPVSVGQTISVGWSTAYPLPAYGASWVGLFRQGTCDEEEAEGQHSCYIASQTLLSGGTSGTVEFSYSDYR